jgi:hydrogenase/urease accessory protein HupE
MGLMLGHHTPMAWIDWLILASAIAFAIWTIARLGFRRARRNVLILAFCSVALMTLGSALGLEDASIGRWALRVAAFVFLLLGYLAARNLRPSSPGGA